jgi:hypothetical protein
MLDVRPPPLPHSAKSRLVRVPDWPKLPADWKLHKTSMVERDSKGNIYVAHRGDHPLFSLHPDGTLRSLIGEDVIKQSTAYDLSGPVPKVIETIYCLHGLHIDPWDNVWITDSGRHTVMRFDPKGKLNLVLGVEDVAGCDATHFNQPTHAIALPTGEIFVTDGYGNSRVAKFSAKGKFIKDWGTRGIEPGQFHTPHTIRLGPDGNLYVCDRENDRVQIFDQDGKHLATWDGLHSMDGICIAPDGRIYGCAGIDHAIIQFGPDGRRDQVWADADKGDYPDRDFRPWPDGDYPHGISVDQDGFIYIAETTPSPLGSRLLKFRTEPKL